MNTVRLEYGGMRFENSAGIGEVVTTIQRMAERHGIDIGPIEPFQLIAATGRASLTGKRATFKVISS
jgi:hypothetical protein